MLLQRLLADESGQSMAEYGLILALIAIAVIVAITALGRGISGKFSEITNALSGNQTP